MKVTEYTQAKDKYLAFLPSSKADSINTLNNYTRVLNDFERYLQAKIAHENDISTVDVLGYRAAIRERGAAQNTARQYLTDLSAFFTWCVRVKLIDESPVSPEDIPEAKEIEYTLLTRDEIDALLEYRPGGAKLGARNRAIITILLQSGLRNSELRALTLSDLDFERGTITVRHGKGDKSRLAPFPALSREAVKEYLTSGYRRIENKKVGDENFGMGWPWEIRKRKSENAFWRPTTARFRRTCNYSATGNNACRRTNRKPR